MKFPFRSMTAGLVAGITAAVVVASGAGAYVFSVHHFETLLETARGTALTQGDLIRVALEHQMMENDRSLIAKMIESFGRQPRVERVALLDRNGVKQFSGGAREWEELSLSSPTCQACHQYPPEQRGSSRVIETGQGTMLRTVIPITNHARCHGCHDASHKINGILLLDYDAGEMHAAMDKDLRWLVGGMGIIGLLLVGAIGLVVRLAVVRRLQRFETAAREIAAGNLERRVPEEGKDTISWMAREFNTMADSMTGLVGEVRQQQERLETVINSIGDGIVVLDEQRNVIAANDAFLKRVGSSREELVGVSCQTMGPGTCTMADCPTRACLCSGAGQVRICERRKPDGGTAWEEVHASPIRDAAGRLTQVVEVWRDISDRREAEARLAESHRLASLGMLASGFSHEMNTPLATVLACVEGILRDADGSIRESAGIAREQVMRCRATTQHFLRLSRGVGAPGGLVDLRATVEAVARLVAPTARAHGVKVDVRVPEEGARVRADEADLHHALVNLLLNAIQASERGGTVTFRAEAGERVKIRVEDRGCGIAPENLQRIFEPFYSGRVGGTGLGLFLAKQFVRRWGGDIAVESEVGKGSAFEIELPGVEA